MKYSVSIETYLRLYVMCAFHWKEFSGNSHKLNFTVWRYFVPYFIQKVWKTLANFLLRPSVKFDVHCDNLEKPHSLNGVMSKSYVKTSSLIGQEIWKLRAEMCLRP